MMSVCEETTDDGNAAVFPDDDPRRYAEEPHRGAADASIFGGEGLSDRLAPDERRQIRRRWRRPCGLESTKVERRGCGTVGDLGIWDDGFIEPLGRLVKFIKQQNAV